ncbi:AIPR family protein [Nocardia brevicatena]|uniref:AIPR family protein n=1 Tax=Nocardia brevicatena TaxID=37327 RepID=UPI0002D5EAD8|nr:AIPR family protein [Nocardia brevicatena]
MTDNRCNEIGWEAGAPMALVPRCYSELHTIRTEQALSTLHISQVAAHIQRHIGPHLDVDDVKQIKGNVGTATLTRGLAALAIQMLTDFRPEQAAACVIDGFQDNGIDAIAVDNDQNRIVIVQSKWHAEGRRSINQGESLKLVNGARDLFSQKFHYFNERTQDLRKAIGEALNNPEVRITIAIATTGPAVLPADVQRPLQGLLAEVNGADDLDDLVDLKVLGLAAFHGFLTERTSTKKVDLDLHLSEWGSVQTPYQAYYGLVPAVEIAGWYDTHHERLFDGNIRNALGRTAVNEALVTTLRQEPHHFWYFNNGITVLAERIGRAARDSHSRTNGLFRLFGATVVNGAQTAAGIHAVMQEDETLLEDAEIWIRVIGLEGCPDGFASSVTRATNTQNGVDARDFIALDPHQDRIRAQLRLQFDKSYGLKRSAEPVTGDDGCDVEEAAIALACSHADPAYAVDAKRQVSLLWASAEDHIYRELFPSNLDIAKMWNSVLALRMVDDELTRMRGVLDDDRATGVLVHGNRLIAHLVLSRLSASILGDPEAEIAGLLKPVAGLTRELSMLLRQAVDEHCPGVFLAPLFKNHSKCRELVTATLSRYTGEPAELFDTAPFARSETKPAAAKRNHKARNVKGGRTRRKPDAVKVIQGAGGLEEGTLLEFRPDTKREKDLLVPWIEEKPVRGRAKWTNEHPAVNPLVWEADGKRYSPSNLVITMMIEAGYPAPSGVRGTTRWTVDKDETLSDIAERIAEDEADSSTTTNNEASDQ